MITLRSRSLRTAVVIVALAFTGNLSAQAPGPAAPGAVMSEELMRRLVTRTMAAQSEAVLNKRAAGLLGLNDGIVNMPALQIGILPDKTHLFNIPLKAGFNDIVIMVKRGDVIEAYLTDKTGVLRAAAIFDAIGDRRLSNEQAAAGYNAELTLWAIEAAALPPTGP